MKKLILILMPVLLLAGGGGGAWWFLLRPAPEAEAVEATNLPVFYAMPAFTVSIVRDRRSYGMITVELSLELRDDATRLIADSHRRAIDALESVVTREHIQCGFERVDGFLFAARPADVPALHEEQEAAARAGLEAQLTRAPVSGAPLALCFAAQAQFQPLDCVFGLAEAVRRSGGQVVHSNEIALSRSRARRERGAGRHG